ncbi:MAG: hypothetical protein QOI95_206 [Acidimicrobiaceae bacterium]|jgi:hypothetical protein
MDEVRGQRTAEVLLTVPGLDDESILVVLVDGHGLTPEEAKQALAAAKEATA